MDTSEATRRVLLERAAEMRQQREEIDKQIGVLEQAAELLGPAPSVEAASQPIAAPEPPASPVPEPRRAAPTPAPTRVLRRPGTRNPQRAPRRDVRTDVRAHFEEHPEPITLAALAERLDIAIQSAVRSFQYWRGRGYLAEVTPDAEGPNQYIKRADYEPEGTGEDDADPGDGNGDGVEHSDPAENAGETPPQTEARTIYDGDARPQESPRHESRSLQQQDEHPLTVSEEVPASDEEVEKVVDLITEWPGEGMTMYQFQDRGVRAEAVKHAGFLSRIICKRRGADVIYALP